MLILIITLSAIYFGFCLFFYFAQHYFFFRPEILDASFQYKYSFPFEELNFPMEDGGRVNAVHFKVPNSRGVIFYLKGNSRSIKGWGKFSKDFLSNGYDFFVMDYRGFGKSRGKRTETKLYNDAQTIYKWLSQQYEEEKIVIYGRSLGSGIAARIASWNNARLLILDSPYFSFYHNINRYLFFVPLRYLMRYNIRTDQYLKTVDCPVHIIHGTKDHLIPFEQSQKLKQLHAEKITLHAIEGGHHNDLPAFASFFATLYEILYVAPKSVEEA